MKKLLIILFAISLLLASCGSKEEDGGNVTEKKSAAASATYNADTGGADTEEAFVPKEGEELAGGLIEAWKDGSVGDFYKYASPEMTALYDGDEFKNIFDGITDVFGAVEGFEKIGQSKSSGQDLFRYRVRTERANVDVTVTVDGAEFIDIAKKVRFADEFDRDCGDGVAERYFLLQSGDYALNAVYTFCDKDGAPAALLIPGSGPSDYNETVGLLEPFRDIALGLAKRGINSLRLEKRTCGYAEKWTGKSGINEVYFEDFTAALKWLEKQSGTERVYLIGHSLGGQVAPIMAEENGVAGVILFNSTARHLADIAADQYTAQDGENGPLYLRYAAMAKKATAEDSTGQYYFGISDYAWASYNEMDFVGAITRAEIPYLIINSRNDKQIFEEDVDLWESEFGVKDNVGIKIFDDVSHQGYPIDASDASALYDRADFCEEVIDTFADFCK